jgi:hypothetical protein
VKSLGGNIENFVFNIFTWAFHIHRQTVCLRALHFLPCLCLTLYCTLLLLFILFCFSFVPLIYFYCFI